MANRAVSYRVLVETRDSKTIGSIHGFKKDRVPDVSLKISCRHGDLGPYLETKLTVLAPASMGSLENKHYAFSKLYSGSFNAAPIVTLLTLDNLEGVPQFVRDTHKFDETALAYGLEQGNRGILKLSIDYQVSDSIHEGLMNTLVFANYIDPETDENLGNKPHIQKAINGLRTLYSQTGTIVFYIRNENTDFISEMDTLWSAMLAESRTGRVIHKFYPAGAIINADGLARTPYLQIGQQLPIEERPQVTTNKTYSYRDFTEFSTRIGYATIQSMEYQKQEVQKFNDTPASMKFITIPGGGSKKYCGVFYIDSEVEMRLKVGDTVWISFKIKLKYMTTDTEWKCQVIDPLEWMKSGEVACIATRPRMPHPQNATEEEKKIPRDFITGRLRAGNGEVETDELLRSELDKQRPIKVQCRLESSDQTYRRQVYAINILQRAQKLEINPLHGAKPRWIERPDLRNWQTRLCNKNQIPEGYTDLLGAAADHLCHLTAEDHQGVIEYLKKVPTSNGIALGIIQGRAGVGKTFVVGEVAAAKLRVNEREKILVLTPSNEPSNVAARKIAEAISKHLEIADLIVMRAHNVGAEKNYIMAYAKLETLKAKIEEDEKKDTDELLNEKNRQVLIAKKKAKDAANEAAEKRRLMEVMQQNLPGPCRKNEMLDMSEGEYIVEDGSDAEESESEGEEGPVALDPDDVLNVSLVPMIQQFDEEVVVSEGCFRADGSIDVERLERDMTLGKAAAGLRMARHLSSYMSAGDRLIHDPRFQEVRQSLAWTLLVVAGMVPDKNKYTDPKGWASFQVLFTKYMEEGEFMDKDERHNLDEATKELREYCVSVTSVLCSTENNVASGLYVIHFPATFVIIDEANRSLLSDFAIVVAHFEPDKILLVGDTKQLKPVVVGPTPLSGFLHELEVSTMCYFVDPGWPSATLYIQRRSRARLMDIAIGRYYHAKAINGPMAHSDEAFPYTKKVMDRIDDLFYDKKVQRYPSMYIEVEGSQAHVDPITKSRYNLKSAALVTNIIEDFEKHGIPPQHQGIVTPYMAQVVVYRYAIHQLHLQDQTKGYNQLLVGTADSMEGEERHVMHIDPVITHEIGFVDDPKRMLVMMTRGKSAQITYGNTKNLYQKTRRESDLIWFFNTAKSETLKICRTVKKNHRFLTHPHVQNRTVAGPSEEDNWGNEDAEEEDKNGGETGGNGDGTGQWDEGEKAGGNGDGTGQWDEGEKAGGNGDCTGWWGEGDQAMMEGHSSQNAAGDQVMGGSGLDEFGWPIDATNSAKPKPSPSPWAAPTKKSA
jgi:hypothetical protein